MRKVTRRDFLKISGASVAAVAISDLGFDVAAAAEKVKECRIKNIKGIPTICPFCGGGCGLVAYSVLDPATNKFVETLSVEGDPDHPVNMGGACAKGAGIFQLRQVGTDVNPRRILKPKYRAAGSTQWVEKDWDWVLDQIAQKIKDTRDKTFVKTQQVDFPVLGPDGKPVMGPDGKPLLEKKEIIVNRTEAIASLGGAALDNEEAYLQSKMMRAMGLVFVEHQARI